MAVKKTELARELEGAIERLDEARSNALLTGDLSGTDFLDSDIDADMAEGIEGVDAALIVAENRIEEFAQVMAEEIENLRRLLETIEDDL
jgi:hypothetical protein